MPDALTHPALAQCTAWSMYACMPRWGAGRGRQGHQGDALPCMQNVPTLQTNMLARQRLLATFPSCCLSASFSSCIPHTAGCYLTALEFTRPSCFCRHRVHKAGVLRASEGAAPASRGGIAKASSSSGRAYTSSGGLPPQQPHTCHSCGVEMGSASRYSRKSSTCQWGFLQHCEQC